MTAASDQSWLVVGVDGNRLILTADPTQMLDDTLHTATISIAGSATDIAATPPIRVALWKGAATPAANGVAPLPYTTVVTDPARPYAYAHNGGASHKPWLDSWLGQLQGVDIVSVAEALK